MIKKERPWLLQKIQAQGVADKSMYAPDLQLFFTKLSPWDPVYDLKKSDEVALSFLRQDEAWWIINHCDEWCCAVNDQVIEPYHRMRLNEGDIIEWGLSSWRLAREEEATLQTSPTNDVIERNPQLPTISEKLDLDWFKRYQLNPNPQDLFEIIPARDIHSFGVSPETNNPLLQLSQEYQQALSATKDHSQRKSDPFPQEMSITSVNLTELRDINAEMGTLQDMVNGEMSIDVILNTLDATGDNETVWPAEANYPDILHLLSPIHEGRKTMHAPMPDLTQREHRIIGIDSHYRITSPKK